MGIGALIGAFVFGGAAVIAGGTLSIFGLSLGLWQAIAVGASLGSLFDAPSFNVQSPTYSLSPAANTTSQIIPVPVVYGRVRVAGNVFYQQFQDSTKKIMYQHIGLSEGPIKSVNTNDVMINDFTTAELSTVTKEVFLGTATQPPSVNEPGGCAYPMLAYVALKMEASEKLGGTPTVTVVLNGRDIDYPGKGEAALYLDAEAEASSGSFKNEASLPEDSGYKGGSLTVDGLLHYYWAGWVKVGDQSEWREYDYQYHDLGILSAVYADTSKDQILCIPFVFVKVSGAHAETISIYPDSTAGTHFDFDVATGSSGDTGTEFTKSLDNGMRLHWEIRKTYESGSSTYYSGVLYILLPSDVLPTSGRAKIVFALKTPYLNLNQVVAGLLPYTDILTDAPWAGFGDTGAYNSPAWCAYDYLTNTRYGAAIPESHFDEDSFFEVANRCAQEGITLNLAVDTQRPTIDNLKDILAPARAFLAIRDTIRLKMDAPVEAYGKLITADDIIEGSFTYRCAPEDQIPNRVTVEFIDGDGENDEGTWERTSYSIEDWEDIARRGVYERRVSMLGITNRAQAKAMCNYLYEQAKRCTLYCSFATSLKNSDIEVGDVIAVTYDLPGWTEKWMRVIGVDDDAEGTVAISLLEYDPQVYDATDDI